MKLGRILLYGIVYWVVGVIITWIQIQPRVSYEISTALFYVSGLVMPIIFCGVFFVRLAGRPGWKDGIRLATVWMIFFTLLDSLVWLWFFEVAVSSYFSWYLALGYAELLIIAAAVAEIVRGVRKTSGPEGLA